MLHGQDNNMKNPFKRKSKYKDSQLDNVIKFMTDKINTYTKLDYKMSKKDRYEFDLLQELMKVIKKT